MFEDQDIDLGKIVKCYSATRLTLEEMELVIEQGYEPEVESEIIDLFD